MKNSLPNKNGYRVLKLRVVAVLIILAIYASIAYKLPFVYNNPSLMVILLVSFVIISVILLLAPITIRYNGYERRI
jgi:RsiW-degrading membrane proteinase PrsW (M82 family)